MTRTQNREALMKWFYECDIKDEWEQLASVPYADRLRSRKHETRYVEQLTHSFLSHRKSVDEAIEKSAEDWRIERIGKVELAILRVAVSELLYLQDIPIAVVVTQALELAKKYATDDSAPFINGILGRIADAR